RPHDRAGPRHPADAAVHAHRAACAGRRRRRARRVRRRRAPRQAPRIARIGGTKVSFFNKAKQAAEQAAAKAREGVEDVQQKRELSQAYGDLGKAAYELLKAGEISHAKLEEKAE